MPDTAVSTAVRNTVSAKHFVRAKKHAAAPTLPRVFERVFDPHSSPILQAFITRALDGIAKDFFPADSSERPPEHDALRQLAAEAPHDTLLALFFLLLNVDTALKEYILMAEDPQRRRKITRFFLDLRQHVVVGFFNNDTMTRSDFVQRCHECYLLA